MSLRTKMIIEDFEHSVGLEQLILIPFIVDKAIECHGAMKHEFVILKDLRFTKVKTFHFFLCYLIDVCTHKALDELQSMYNKILAYNS